MQILNRLPQQTGQTTTSSQTLALCRFCRVPTLGPGTRCPLCGSTEVIHVDVCWVENAPNSLRSSLPHHIDSATPPHAA